jgi:hypothetical protein
MASQPMIEIIGDIDEDETFHVNGMKMSGAELKKTYSDILSSELNRKVGVLKKMFGNVYSVQKILFKEIENNKRYNQDLINYIQIDENGNFKIPLYDPAISTQIQNLFNSIWRKQLKYEISGG